MRRYFKKFVSDDREEIKLFLYHYSAEKHSVLKSIEKQNKLTHEDKEKWDKLAREFGRMGAYYQHISFFFEPIPLDIISKVFSGQHPVWYSGNVLYEHKVSIDDLGEFSYELVESPEVTELYYNPRYDNYSDKEWIKLKNKITQENGYTSNTPEELINAISKNIGSVRDAYIQLPHRLNFQDIKLKYAATVPHLMIYPKSGMDNVTSVSKVVIK